MRAIVVDRWMEPGELVVGEAPEPALLPDWDPVMKYFAEEAATPAGQRVFCYNPTFGRDGKYYTKVEICVHERFASEFLRIVPPEVMAAMQGRQ